MASFGGFAVTGFSHKRILISLDIFCKRTQTGIIVLAVAWPVAGLLAGIWIAIQVRIVIDTAFTVDVSFATTSLLYKYPISNFSIHVCHFAIFTNVRSLLRPASAAQRTGECIMSPILLSMGYFILRISLAHSSLTEINFATSFATKYISCQHFQL